MDLQDLDEKLKAIGRGERAGAIGNKAEVLAYFDVARDYLPPSLFGIAEAIREELSTRIYDFESAYGTYLWRLNMFYTQVYSRDLAWLLLADRIQIAHDILYCKAMRFDDLFTLDERLSTAIANNRDVFATQARRIKRATLLHVGTKRLVPLPHETVFSMIPI